MDKNSCITWRLKYYAYKVLYYKAVEYPYIYYCNLCYPSILVSMQVTEYNSFWEYCNKTLLPSLWPDEWYDGVIRDEGFAADRNSFRVGVPRLRQLRIDGGE
mgnify:CR=1 FL=1